VRLYSQLDSSLSAFCSGDPNIISIFHPLNYRHCWLSYKKKTNFALSIMAKSKPSWHWSINWQTLIDIDLALQIIFSAVILVMGAFTDNLAVRVTGGRINDRDSCPLDGAYWQGFTFLLY
jgi:hypothetical protein